MSLSSQWEYLTVLVSTELLDYEELHPKSVNCKRQGDSEPSADGKLSHLLAI